jgi:hypothetical protein
MLGVVMLVVVMLCDVMLAVIMLSVVASLYEVLKVEGNLKGFDQLSLFLPHIKGSFTRPISEANFALSYHAYKNKTFLLF